VRGGGGAGPDHRRDGPSKIQDKLMAPWRVRSLLRRSPWLGCSAPARAAASAPACAATKGAALVIIRCGLSRRGEGQGVRARRIGRRGPGVRVATEEATDRMVSIAKVPGVDVEVAQTLVGHTAHNL